MKHIIFIFFSLPIAASCFAQAYFDLRTKYPTTTNSSYITNLSGLVKYSEQDIQSAFETIKKSSIEFNYPQGGCQNRAHVMSLILSKKFQIVHSKVWLFSPSNISSSDNRKLEINDKNKLSPNDVIQWNYHVAPCVLVSKNNKTDTLIIDPALNDQRPMRFSEWTAAMKNSNESMYTFLNPDWYFFITDNAGKTITGEFYKFEIDNRFCSDNFRSLTLEKGLAINDMAIYVLNKYLNNIRNSNSSGERALFISLRKVFGNVDVLTEFFGKLNSYCGATVADNISLKQVFQENNKLMTDAMIFYLLRLSYWAEEIQKLK